jgi:sulfur transfer complex TusBCD TusB component (DsrH family)
VVEVETFLGAEAVPQAAQLDGKGPLVADEGVRGLIAASASPQLKLCRVQPAHFQVLQRQLDAAARGLVGSHAERFALQQKHTQIVRIMHTKKGKHFQEREQSIHQNYGGKKEMHPCSFIHSGS